MIQLLTVATYSAIVGAVLAMSACATAPQPTHIIDTHIHLFDTSRPQGVPWPPKDDKDLYRPTLPRDFKAVAKPAHVTGAVIVEASEWVDDNQWLLDLVKGDDYFIGIVGNLEPGSADFGKNLARFASDRRFVGIRPRLPQPKNMLDAKYLADLAKLADRGLTLDVLMHGVKLSDVAEVARRVPKLRIVINHLAGANANGEAPDPQWVAAVKAVAAQPNVYCKVSGLYQQARVTPAPTKLAHYRPVLDVLWDAFGEDRLVFASNWPVLNKRGKYAEHLAIVKAYFAKKGQAVMEKVFWQNAVRAYRLPFRL